MLVSPILDLIVAPYLLPPLCITHSGYTGQGERPTAFEGIVLTPDPPVQVLWAGYQTGVHPSVRA